MVLMVYTLVEGTTLSGPSEDRIIRPGECVSMDER